MKTEYIKYIAYFIVAALVVLLIQLYFPAPINWSKNYNSNSKDPYGLYVFDKELPNLVPSKKITKTALNPYEYFEKNEINDANVSFLIIENTNALDVSSIDKILEKVSNGADLILAYENYNYYNQAILDTLGIASYSVPNNVFKFVGNHLPNDTIVIKDEYNHILSVNKPEIFTAIAKLNHNLSFIATKFGNGNIYITSTPVLLTNYYLLKKDSKAQLYAEGFVSYINKKEIIWFDQHYKKENLTHNNSILKVVFQHKPLRFAWYTLFIGLFLFMFFYGKRRQRIVPVIEPIKNTSVEFIETVGNLYYQEKNHTELLKKQITYTLHYIRTNYKIATENIDQDFIEKLQQKTLANTDDITEFVTFIKSFNDKNKYTQNDVLNFNKLLEKLNINYGKSRK